MTGGTLRADAPSYVERQADHQLLGALLQGEFCYVLTARQTGKSSLMVRTAIALRQQNVTGVVLDLTAIGQNLTAEQWYGGLLVQLGRQIGMEDEADAYWFLPSVLGPLQRWMAFLRDTVLTRCTGDIVIFIDEIDTVRSLPFSADEFFAGIRECYNRRSEDPAFDRLTFCLLGVATPSDLIQDTRTTPFNIGRRIALDDFTPEEAQPLTRGFSTGSTSQALSILERVLYWTGGHPYLTQYLCHEASKHPSILSATDVDSLCKSLLLTQSARETNDNLTFVRNSLLHGSTDTVALLDRYQAIRSHPQKIRPDITDPIIAALQLSGIVKISNGYLRVRNETYNRVFDARWIKSQISEEERRPHRRLTEKEHTGRADPYAHGHRRLNREEVASVIEANLATLFQSVNNRQ